MPRVRSAATDATPLDARSAAVVELAWTVLDTFVRMKVVSDRLTAEEGQTTPRLGVLREIVVHGPLTVAQVARARRVARQGVQRLADEMVRDGLAVYATNPSHRRSPLLQLTTRGRQVTARLLARQNAIARAAAPQLDLEDVRRATALLREFAEQVEAGASSSR